MNLKSFRLKPQFLLALPALAYGVSYVYLAFYHNKWWLLNTIVHEGGTYTFWQDLLYASHFLGHIPVHIVLSFVLLGAYFSLTRPESLRRVWRGALPAGLVLLLFLAASVLLSVLIFGVEDTWNFVAQQKQSVVTYGEGGSWNLHIPSTMLQFALIPVFVFAAKACFGGNLIFARRGLIWVIPAALLFFVMTYAVNGNIVQAIVSVWQTPRYLAHSVRELATFPLTYYPLPLYFLLRNEHILLEKTRRVSLIGIGLITALGLVFCLGLTYQVSISLTEGVGNMAQKPVFARGGQLEIQYLLAAHYFEHFLDSVFFLMFTLFAYNLTYRSFRSQGA